MLGNILFDFVLTEVKEIGWRSYRKALESETYETKVRRKPRLKRWTMLCNETARADEIDDHLCMRESHGNEKGRRKATGSTGETLARLRWNA